MAPPRIHPKLLPFYRRGSCLGFSGAGGARLVPPILSLAMLWGTLYAFHCLFSICWPDRAKFVDPPPEIVPQVAPNVRMAYAESFEYSATKGNKGLLF